MNKDVLLPIFDDVIDGNSPGWAHQCAGNPKKCYRIYGFGGFHITGFRFPGGKSWTQGTPPPCGPPNTCIGGYFVRIVSAADGAVGGGPDLGAYVIRLVE
jgi:hypothetical protein